MVSWSLYCPIKTVSLCKCVCLHSNKLLVPPNTTRFMWKINQHMSANPCHVIYTWQNCHSTAAELLVQPTQEQSTMAQYFIIAFYSNWEIASTFTVTFILYATLCVPSERLMGHRLNSTFIASLPGPSDQGYPSRFYFH